MQPLGPRSVRLRTQILLLQVAVVGLTLGLAFGVFAYVSGQRLSDEYGQRALAIARTVASDPEVRADVAHYASIQLRPGPELRQQLADGDLEHLADEARLRTGALFVVITDDAGIRLAHPDRSRLGEMVSTDPSKALSGAEVVIREHGTLGESVRAKVPVLEPDPANGEVPAGASNARRVVGEVSVGISTEAVRSQLFRDLRRAGLLIGGALLAGIAGSVLLARRWHGLTLGLEPSELAELVREQDAVLHGIGEGVVAADTAWRSTVVNDEARRLLGVDPSPGSPVDEIGLTPRVLEAFRAADGQPVQAAVGERIVVVTARTVHRDGRPLGAVLSVRDRTDVESLTRQLDAVRSMSTVLRAQRHEFANRLHLLSGLLQTNRPDEATHYLTELLDSGPLGAALPGMDTIQDPYLQAFLSAKAAHARENGVHLRLGPNTWVDANLTDPVDVTTVLGNLLDNAIEAARTAPAPEVTAPASRSGSSGGGDTPESTPPELPDLDASERELPPRLGGDAIGRGIAGGASRSGSGGGGDTPEFAPPELPQQFEAAGDASRSGSGGGAEGVEFAPAELPRRVVEVELVRDGDTLHIAVADSGAGVAAELGDSVFTEGVSTRVDAGVPGGRGVGLALSRQVARARGGDVRLVRMGGSVGEGPGERLGESGAGAEVLRGAEFHARLPGVLAEGESAWAEEI
ncbi:sensor histidine kinase [Nocardia sp. NPDC051030]|uniref:sensor histidine kinase n=1 Tax=Nocardia sp. NPDC051030 TaxID=3155162 RepID=UPI00342EE7CA